MNVKSSNNTSKWQMGFNSAFKELMNGCSAFLFWLIDKQGDKVLGNTTFFFAAHFTGSYICKDLSHFS
jgi:hypothetical protein